MCICLVLPYWSVAGESRERPEQVIRDAVNPITDRTSVPILNTTSFRAGPFNRTSNATLFQPVLPLSLGRSYAVFHPIIPVLYRPTFTEPSGGELGLGDSTLQIYFVPEPPEPLTWGFGTSLLLPTASDEDLGSEKWGIGPVFAAIWATDQWTVGGRLYQHWSFAGDDTRKDVSFLTIQPLLTYSLRKGWYLASGPLITADFSAGGSEQWTVPVGGGVGKVFAVGRQHLNVSVQPYWNAVGPESAGEWSLIVQLQSLFPRIQFQ